MLTGTDIPPGGEGKIEVTFDTSHKTGQQKKSITVESNDPRNPRASLYVSANIEIVFGFEQYAIDLGRIVRGQPVSLTTTLLLKDTSLKESVTFVCSSPYITAALVEAPQGKGSEAGKLTVEVAVSPEMPAGKINATLTARAASSPDASVQVQGNVIGSLEVLPDIVQFHVDTSKSASKPATQVVKVTGTSDTAPLRLIRVEDVNQKLQIQVDTLVAGREYEIALDPQASVLQARLNLAGTINITTDDKEQPVISVTYFISFGR